MEKSNEHRAGGMWCERRSYALSDFAVVRPRMTCWAFVHPPWITCAKLQWEWDPNGATSPHFWLLLLTPLAGPSDSGERGCGVCSSSKTFSSLCFKARPAFPSPVSFICCWHHLRIDGTEWPLAQIPISGRMRPREWIRYLLAPSPQSVWQVSLVLCSPRQSTAVPESEWWS